MKISGNEPIYLQQQYRKPVTQLEIEQVFNPLKDTMNTIREGREKNHASEQPQEQTRHIDIFA
jgi:hypothetical protein